MDQYKAMIDTARVDYAEAVARLENLHKHPGIPRDIVRVYEDKATRLRAVVEALTVYTTGQGMHMHWH